MPVDLESPWALFGNKLFRRESCRKMLTFGGLYASEWTSARKNLLFGQPLGARIGCSRKLSLGFERKFMVCKPQNTVGTFLSRPFKPVKKVPTVF